ncbi:MAG: 4-hydroxybenzoyl-CoA reductase subunit beta [Planctomycetes bacterium]|jgi:4-hydroxybenzoyl-CoA reductase subunit beta|nr:4-hydroxybenzoyl-CoA reductase subunit beta [Planctomycetota bacterium]MBT4028558.1 4-hydroxybenzoyl-CoA reductase subunit beta [Planctomycetota bacterium]MBT4559450.1 4-hydroxybenzoyl-CoA reductase subunit beta [Planctomycetota bacterium]MBT5100613.1 4-hydroxybenzoyl-CoA reductase subunit beta [Planctomycetota bacterium]MBT7319023.1 4-hydroxybenzoyl-CoA reductase subunit beta [Planctomycetota bacterium]
MRIPDLQLHRPANLTDAFSAAQHCASEGFDWLGGGTDLLCNYKWGLNVRPHLLSLKHIAELHDCSPDSLSSARTLHSISHDGELASRYPALVEAAQMVASPLIRRTATLGGNLLLDTRCWHFNQTASWREAHGSCLKAEADTCRVVPKPGNLCVAAYSGDLAPILLALDASVEWVGPQGSRIVSLSEVYQEDGIRRFRDKANSEILTRVILPEASETWVSAYQKLRLRETIDFPEGGVAVALRIDGGFIAEARVATTAYAPIPLLHDSVAAGLVGAPIDIQDESWASRLELLADQLRAQVRPMKNTSMSPAYRKRMAGVLLKRAIQKALAR